MVKSPEEYLSAMTYNADSQDGRSNELDAGERAFIEKYLGQDALDKIPVQNPEALPLPKLADKPVAQPLLLKEPEIVIAPPKSETKDITAQTVAPVKKIVVAPVVEPIVETPPVVQAATAETEAVAEDIAPVIQAAATRTEAIAESVAPVKAAVETPVQTQTETRVAAREKTTSRTIAKETTPVKTETIQKTETAAIAVAKQTSEVKTAAKAGCNLAEEITLREKMRQAAEIQVVSFFVSDQLFLLPVAGIQEVVRHMDLIKVPQAPDFIAGAINLRGTVMPLVRLSSLLTNEPDLDYDKSNFVIITGSEKLRMGLIIDRVSSMHMIPQNKIIWNAESKLGEAAEFLSAIVDLDDKVCGMVAPDNIAQKILPELSMLP